MHLEELIPAAGAGDREAMEQLLRANLGLVYKAVIMAIGDHDEADEWMWLAADHFMRCCRKYDPSLGYRPSTYFVACIKGAVYRKRSLEKSRTSKRPAHFDVQARENVQSREGNPLDILIQREEREKNERVLAAGRDLTGPAYARARTIRNRLGMSLDSYVVGHRSNFTGKRWLNEADVAVIKDMLDAGMLQKSIAQKFNVDVGSISKIRTGERWKEVV